MYISILYHIYIYIYLSVCDCVHVQFTLTAPRGIFTVAGRPVDHGEDLSHGTRHGRRPRRCSVAEALPGHGGRSNSHGPGISC